MKNNNIEIPTRKGVQIVPKELKSVDITTDEIYAYFKNKRIEKEINDIIKNGISGNDWTFQIKKDISIKNLTAKLNDFYEYTKQESQRKTYKNDFFCLTNVICRKSGYPCGFLEKVQKNILDKIKIFDENNKILKSETEKNINNHIYVNNNILFIENIKISSKNTTKLNLDFWKDYHSIWIINSSLEKVGLSCKDNLNELWIYNSHLSALSNIDDVKIIEIIKSGFGDIIFEKINGILSFDKESYIKNNYSRLLYSKLKREVLENKDTIQAHIFYTKELEEYRESDSSNKDDKVLIKINSWLNDNGLSFIKPVVWIFALNFLIVFSIHFYLINIESFSFWNILNISPFHKIYNGNEVDQFIIIADSMRRVGLGVLFYLIISSATRFRFKK